MPGVAAGPGAVDAKAEELGEQPSLFGGATELRDGVESAATDDETDEVDDEEEEDAEALGHDFAPPGAKLSEDAPDTANLDADEHGEDEGGSGADRWW